MQPLQIRELIARCLEEDLGRGDLTTEACIPPGTKGKAVARARETLVFCGLPVVEEVFRQVDLGVVMRGKVEEGAWVEAGDSVFELAGEAGSILAGERLALNFVQRLSATATLTRRLLEALPQGSETRITDTRKTTPGLRFLERYAVRCGGGRNHRADLGAAVLIKDNHIAAAGGVKVAVERARERASHTGRITCEVDTVEQLREALEAGADIVMLDNFADEDLESAVRLVDGRALVEVSGGVTLERIPKIGAAGVDVISVGALTHSAGSVDLGLDWER